VSVHPLTESDLVAFVSTAQPPAAMMFYRDVLGLRLVDESQFALVFDANGTMLRISVVGEVNPAPYTVLGWAVADIAAAIDALLDAGVTFLHFDGMDQDKRGIWRSPSAAQVAWFADPDGNVLSLTQR
jgi:catechol 2,3-dioxygenase-like lactoylglutathione lyase family enzyme